MIYLLIFIWILTVAAAYWYQDKIKREATLSMQEKESYLINELKIIMPLPERHAKNLISEITPKEQLLLLEYRLREAGYKYCMKCGKVSGLIYIDKKGVRNPVQLLVREVNGKKVDICQKCFSELGKKNV